MARRATRGLADDWRHADATHLLPFDHTARRRAFARDRGLCLDKNRAMGTLWIATTLGAATGWGVCSYVYGQLSPAFKNAHPLLTATLAGAISGAVGLAVLNVVNHIMST
jgi:hypothetical protein